VLSSKRELVLTVLAVVLVGSFFFVWFNSQTRLEGLLVKLEGSNRKILELEAKSVEYESEISSLEGDLAKYTSEVSNLQEQIQTMETVLSQSKEKISSLERQIEELEGKQTIEKFAHLTVFVCWSDESPVLANQKEGYISKLELRDVRVSLKDHPEKVLMSLESWSCSKNNTKFITILVPIFSEKAIVLFEGECERTYSFEVEVEETGLLPGGIGVVGPFQTIIIISEDTVFYEWLG